MHTYTIPSHVLELVASLGYQVPYDDMRPYMLEWDSLYRAEGKWWDWDEVQNGIYTKMHRRSIRPAQLVCDEWASLIMDEKTQVSAEDASVNEWLSSWTARSGFMAQGQELVKRAFALGTGAWAVWADTERGEVKLRPYSGTSVLPLSWDVDGVMECAFASQAVIAGKRYDQLQVHVLEGETYRIKSYAFDSETGKRANLDGVAPDVDTGCRTPTFALVKPAIGNEYVDFSPYGQSVYAHAADALRDVDACYDAVMNEVDLAKMRVFISDMLIEYTDGDGNRHANPLPWGNDNRIFRKVSSTEDMVSTFSPAMRTAQQVEAYRLALRTVGDLCGFGLDYFDLSKTGGVQTATAVAANNSQLMRTVRKHENALADSISQAVRSFLAVSARYSGAPDTDPGAISVDFDDSIISDTASEKAQDMAEVGVTMQPWEYRVKWYGEDEETAKAKAPGSSVREPAFGE